MDGVYIQLVIKCLLFNQIAWNSGINQRVHIYMYMYTQIQLNAITQQFPNKEKYIDFIIIATSVFDIIFILKVCILYMYHNSLLRNMEGQVLTD